MNEPVSDAEIDRAFGFLTKGIGCVVGIAALVVAAPGIFLLGLYVWVELNRIGWAERVVPPQVEVTGTIRAEPGFMRALPFGGPSCADYELTPAFASQLAETGVAALSGAEFLWATEWRETPVAGDAFGLFADGDTAYALRGQCGQEYADRVERALNEPGSLYALAPSRGNVSAIFVVMPYERRAAFLGYN